MKFFSIFLLLLSTSAFGHSQYPSRIVKEPFYEEQVVEITLNNLNSYVQSYEVSVDEKIVGTVKNLGSGIERRLTVNLKGVREGEEKLVCSTSILDRGQSVRTRVCTKVEFKW
ncbi:hypothetical protein V5J35_004311 [Endozoicomonas sp. NE40]|uniref:Uncharacterized protein n=1 Tax=Endozoicomonas lisbonensis TaxID=3120522 RepID=A0ABV2SPR6_9GAMM